MDKLENYIIVSLETTGLNHLVDEILKIEAIRIENGNIVDTFKEFIKPKFEIPKEASRINGITFEDVKNSPSIEEVLDKFKNFRKKGDILVAYNAEFVSKFIGFNFKRYKNSIFSHEFIDLLSLVRYIYKNIPSYNLKYVATYLKIDSTNKDKTIICYEILKNLKNKIGDNQEKIFNGSECIIKYLDEKELKKLNKDSGYKKEVKKKWLLIILTFLVVFLGCIFINRNSNEKILEIKYGTSFDGKIVPQISDGKIKLEIMANVPDGAILETTLVGYKGKEPTFNVQNIVIKDGKGEFIADISDWNHGYLSAMAMFRFNSDEIIQPKNIKALYGEHGEKMEGVFIQENHLKGYNGILKYKQIPYPSYEVLRAENKDNFNYIIINTFKDVPKSIVNDIQLLELTNYSIRVNIVVGDGWYNLSLSQKEKLVTQLSSAFKELAVKNYQAANNENVVVFFMSKSGNEVAAPKAFGGYEIK